MKTIYSIHVAALKKTVFIADQASALALADAQTAETGTPHSAEPVDLNDDATAVTAQIDKAIHDQTVAGFTPSQRRVFGIAEPKKTTAASATAAAAKEE